jgi:hypothetical protein
VGESGERDVISLRGGCGVGREGRPRPAVTVGPWAPAVWGPLDPGRTRGSVILQAFILCRPMTF